MLPPSIHPVCQALILNANLRQSILLRSSSFYSIPGMSLTSSVCLSADNGSCLWRSQRQLMPVDA